MKINIVLLSFVLLNKITLKNELSPNNFLYKDTIVINFRSGGSVLLSKDGKILKNNQKWTILYNNELYEFSGGTDGSCLSYYKTSFDNKKIGFIVGCEKEGYEVKLNDGKISLGGDIVDFGILKNKAFIFVDGTIYIYDLKNNKEEKKIRNISELGMGKFLCNNNFCVFSDLTNKLIIYDSLGNEVKRFYNQKWVYVSLLALNNDYLLFAHYNFREGGFVNLVNLKNFSILFKKGMSYVEGDNTACILKNYIVLIDGENIYKINFNGIVDEKMNLKTQWIICSDNLIVSGGLDKDRNVYILKP
ncbi:MAG: hypothetical protein ABIL76_03640 [candidate division WOR-3 bacterium]